MPDLEALKRRELKENIVVIFLKKAVLKALYYCLFATIGLAVMYIWIAALNFAESYFPDAYNYLFYLPFPAIPCEQTGNCRQLIEQALFLFTCYIIAGIFCGYRISHRSKAVFIFLGFFIGSFLITMCSSSFIVFLVISEPTMTDFFEWVQRVKYLWPVILLSAIYITDKVLIKLFSKKDQST